MGYCNKGTACSDRHVHECPDYANDGVCSNSKCHLPHVDRAGQIKKHIAANTPGLHKSPAEQEEDSDIVSEEDEESDDEDVDSDGMEMVMDLSDDAASHAISEQQDYVRF